MRLAAPKRLIEAVRIDFRALAVFRVALALIVLWDLVVRLPNLAAHYSDLGITPRALAILENPEMTWLSAHFLSGGTAWPALLFGLTFLSAITLLLGYRARLASVVTWYLMMSLQSRNEGLNYGADHMLRMLLMWAIFLPLDRRWAWARKNQAGHVETSPLSSIASVASAGILLQVVGIYFFSALLKITAGPHWIPNGDAVAIAFSNPTLTRPWAAEFLRFPHLTQALTYGTLALELSAPWLLLPWFRARAIQWLGVLAFVALHLGILALQALALFPFVSLTALLLFIPSEFWNRLESRVGAHHDSRPILASRGLNLLAGALVVTVLSANLDYVGTRANLGDLLPQTARAAVLALRLEQRWSMFARPVPWFNWYAMRGVDQKGHAVDPWNGVDHYEEKGGIDPQRIFRDPRWTTYLRYPTRPFAGIYEGEKKPFGDYLCRKWAREHAAPGTALERIQVYYFSSSPSRSPAEASRELLWEMPCSG